MVIYALPSGRSSAIFPWEVIRLSTFLVSGIFSASSLCPTLRRAVSSHPHSTPTLWLLSEVWSLLRFPWHISGYILFSGKQKETVTSIGLYKSQFLQDIDSIFAIRNR